MATLAHKSLFTSVPSSGLGRGCRLHRPVPSDGSDGTIDDQIGLRRIINTMIDLCLLDERFDRAFLGRDISRLRHRCAERFSGLVKGMGPAEHDGMEALALCLGFGHHESRSLLPKLRVALEAERVPASVQAELLRRVGAC